MTNKHYHYHNRDEPWLVQYWRPLAFVVYAIICLFDFVIMPTVFEIHNKHIDPTQIVQLSLQFKDSATQIAFMSQYNPTNQWVPLTMGGAAAFHFAFGALLTAGAYTRGQLLVERQRQANAYSNQNPPPGSNPSPFKLGQNTQPDNPGP